MSVYVFDQSVGYIVNNMDNKKRFQEQVLGASALMKYIFMDIPEPKRINDYRKIGVNVGQLISMYQYFADNNALECSVKVEDKLEELRDVLHYTDIIYRETEIWLNKDGYVIAVIMLNEKKKDCFWGICYYSYAKLLRMEVYTNEVIYVNHYMTAKSENRLYAKLTRRTFHNGNGTVVYEQIFKGEKEWFVFPDGKRYTKQEFAMEFIKRLRLSSQDIVILDNSIPKEFVKAVFTFGKVARIIVVILAKGGDAESLEDYYYWFPYSEMISDMVVSTDEQKDILIKELMEYHHNIPDIKAFPMNGKFVYTVLRESYGGNLALSWNFSGKPDGFLIYDESGTKLYETRNIYQHYFLIKGYKKESSFVLKAYVDTAKGRMVIAESESIFLNLRRYEKPIVSLVIPVYNAENYIARTLDNALGQSLTDLEILAVDDGSSDSTSEILDWYAEKYRNVIVIHKENEGVAVARNTGMEAASGEYIGFMDNDDMIRPEMMKRLYDAAKKSDSDIAITSYYEIRNNGYVGFMEYAMEEDVAVSADEFFQKWYMPGNEGGCVLWNKLYRASFIKKHKIPDMPFDDLAWTTCLLLYAKRVCYLNGHFYEWDRSIRNGTLLNEWYRFGREEVIERRKNVILYYLENGNLQKRRLLKEAIKVYLLRWERDSGYEEYGKLWKWVEENF